MQRWQPVLSKHIASWQARRGLSPCSSPALLGRGADVGGGEPGPGADVGGGEPRWTGCAGIASDARVEHGVRARPGPDPSARERRTRASVCVQACIRACMRGCVRVCVRVCERVCARACMRACMRGYVRVCVRACACVRPRALVCMGRPSTHAVRPTWSTHAVRPTLSTHAVHPAGPRPND